VPALVKYVEKYTVYEGTATAHVERMAGNSLRKRTVKYRSQRGGISVETWHHLQ
jgi:hypothetical protein